MAIPVVAIAIPYQVPVYTGTNGIGFRAGTSFKNRLFFLPGLFQKQTGVALLLPVSCSFQHQPPPRESLHASFESLKKVAPVVLLLFLLLLCLA